MNTQEQQRWETAQQRVSFKIHLYTYLIINGLFWIFWAFTTPKLTFAWPLFPTLGWGIGLAFHYFEAYHSKNKLVQKEYEKLKRAEED
jgi:hypothetical protein